VVWDFFGLNTSVKQEIVTPFTEKEEERGLTSGRYGIYPYEERWGGGGGGQTLGFFGHCSRVSTQERDTIGGGDISGRSRFGERREGITSRGLKDEEKTKQLCILDIERELAKSEEEEKENDGRAVA